MALASKAKADPEEKKNYIRWRDRAAVLSLERSLNLLHMHLGRQLITWSALHVGLFSAYTVRLPKSRSAFRFTHENAEPKDSVLFLLALLVGALVVGFWLFRPFLQPFAFATVIGIGFYPLHVDISRIVRGPNKAALLTTLTVLLIIVLPALLVASSAGGELIKAARYLNDRSTHQGGAFIHLGNAQRERLHWLGKYVDVEALRLEDSFANLPSLASKFLLAAGTGLVAGSPASPGTQFSHS